ncbi:MAG: homocysteine S-methyltransferase family protein, partial [Smithellaceae bacterium]|nr:homocysteine S-methyltransferase family protein [Smithellaceae bacterium]
NIAKAFGRTVLIGSGAIGTCLRGTVGIGDEPVELLNLRSPEMVKSLHTVYRQAGSQILVTNTFAANALVLGEAGAGDLCDDVNRAGVALAGEAGGEQCLVWASVGPLGLGLRLEDYPDTALEKIYRRQCDALIEADALLLETFVDPREARAALAAAARTGRPVIFQIGNTGGGAGRWSRVNQLLEEANHAGVIAVGTNCRHPEEIVRVASHITARTDLPVTASANAGHPQIERGAVTYEYSPEAFAAFALTLADAGVSVIGGCCGTTPDHIRKLSEVLGGRAVAARPQPAISAEPVSSFVRQADAAENPVRSLLERKRFIISVEIRAERTRSLDEIVQGAAVVAKAGADMFDVPDNPGATVGRDAMVTAGRLQSVLKVPSICHLGVTQSNLMRLHSSLIGGWDLGLRGLLAVTGDAPSMGHLGSLAHRVMDVRSSVELLRLIRSLREGKIINGEGLADPPDFCAGCAIARPIPAQIKWLKAKIDAGAEFVFSQPVFTLDDFRSLRDALAGLPVRFFPGIMPLTSRRNAAFLAGGRIPGIAVPSEVAAGFEQYESPEDQRRFGLDRACELAAGIAAEASGLYLIMPFGKSGYEDAARIVREARKRR